MNPTENNHITEPQRRFLTRAEIATLVGMSLCVASLFLVWKQEPFSQETLRAMPATLVVNVPADVQITGFGLMLRWPLTLCAALCGASLLVTPTRQNQGRMAAIQISAAAVCLLVPLSRFGIKPGVITSLAGGALLLYGALERFGIGSVAGNSQTSANG